MHVFEVFEARLTYRGYPCTKDCSGHQAEYNSAELYGNSNSFQERCLSFTTSDDFTTTNHKKVYENRLTNLLKQVNYK